MAEGGEDSQDNPFSFKKFVKKQSNNTTPTSEDDNTVEEKDLLDLPDLGVDTHREKDRAKQQDEKIKKNENPFSFKRFLNGGARPKTGPGSVGSSLATLDLANDLPDFVQDHFTHSSEFQNRRSWNQPQIPLPDFGASRQQTDVPLPDFALDSTSPKPGYPEVSLPSPKPDDDFPPVLLEDGANPRSNKTPDNVDLGLGGPFGNGNEIDPIMDNDLNNDSDSENVTIPIANTTGGLPDFLSDSTVNTSQVNSESLIYSHVNGDITSELRQLQEENRELRRQLEESRQFAETESKRVAKVVQEMESIQKREAEDTAALENMVQQVEANLQQTTRRAVQAEKNVSKFKQEVKTLQAQIKALETENQALKVGQGAPNVVREKAKFASHQLSEAAKTAELRLKELMGGVETLKLVSEVLASIDKITEEGANGGTSGGGSPSDADSGATGGSSS